MKFNFCIQSFQIRLVILITFSLITSIQSSQAQQVGSKVQSNQSLSLGQWLKENTTLTYWSMITGPSLSNPAINSVDANGDPFAMNWWHLAGVLVNLNSNHQIGIQQRVSVDIGSNEFESDVYLQNPRPIWNIKNVIDNDFINLGLTNGLEIVTESKWRNRGLLTSIMLSQNWSFKSIPSPFSLGMQTTLLPLLYSQSTGQPNLRVMMIPYGSYTINDTFSIMSWAWFDAEHFSDTSLNQWGSMSDDYLRLGLNINFSKNISVFPCLQSFISKPQLNTSTYGLEFSANF